MVPFTLFFVYGFPYKIANPKKGALIIIWLLGFHGRSPAVVVCGLDLRMWRVLADFPQAGKLRPGHPPLGSRPSILNTDGRVRV